MRVCIQKCRIRDDIDLTDTKREKDGNPKQG